MTSGRSQEKRGKICNGIYIYIYHFYSLDVEAGIYGDTGGVIGFFYEVKQLRSRLIPGWVTAVLDFVEDPVSNYSILDSRGCQVSWCGQR